MTAAEGTAPPVRLCLDLDYFGRIERLIRHNMF